MLEIIDSKDESFKCFSKSSRQYYCNKKVESNIIQRIFILLLEPIYILCLYLISKSAILCKIFNSNPKRLNIGFLIVSLITTFMALFLQNMNANYPAMVVTSLVSLNIIYLMYIELVHGKGYPLEISEGRQIDKRRHKYIDQKGYGTDQKGSNLEKGDGSSKVLSNSKKNNKIIWEE